MGRKSGYSPELTDKICVRIMDGESLRSICREDDMPAISTVMYWLLEFPEFQSKYDFARKVQAEVDFDDIREIADTPKMGTKMTSKPGADGKTITETITGDMIEHRRLQVDARKWRLARMNPKKFGEKLHQEHSGPDGKPIEFSETSLTDEERASRVLALLETAKKRRESGEDKGGTGSPAA